MSIKTTTLLIIIAGLGLTACNRSTTPSVTEDAPLPTVEEVDTAVDETALPSPKVVLTLDEIAKHASPDNCWFAVEGKVYDVTAFIAQGIHPGGEAILTGCGQDATEVFNNRPSDGQPHSATARLGLEKYYLGQLVTIPDSATTSIETEATSSSEVTIP